MAGGAVDRALQSLDERAGREQRVHLLSEFSCLPEIQAFTAKSFVLLTHLILIFVSC